MSGSPFSDVVSAQRRLRFGELRPRSPAEVEMREAITSIVTDQMLRRHALVEAALVEAVRLQDFYMLDRLVLVDDGHGITWPASMLGPLGVPPPR